MPLTTPISIFGSQSAPFMVINAYEKMAFRSSFEFFGGSIAFKRISEYTITTVFSDISNPMGEIIDFATIEAIKNKKDYYPISLNGSIIERARLKSFQLREGNFNKNATITLVFEVQERADAVTGSYYGDFAAALADTAIVDSISESTNVSRGENSLEFSQNLNIKFSPAGLNGPNEVVVRRAQLFAQSIFDANKTADYSFIPDLETDSEIRRLLNGDFKKFTTESINTISNECSFTQSLSAQNVKQNTSYSHSSTQSVSIGQDGIATAKESGEIKGLTGGLDRLASAEAGYSAEIALAMGRLTETLERYYDCTTPLHIFFTSKSKTINKFEGTISYSVSATNDPKYTEYAEGVFHQSTLTLSKDNGVESAKKSGTIEGLSDIVINGSANDISSYKKFAQAYTFYKNVADLNYNGYSPKPVSRSVNLSLLKGSVQYEVFYSDDPKYKENNRFKSISANSSKSDGKKSKNEFRIINNQILIQEMLGQEKGSQQISVDIVGYRTSTYQQMLTEAKSIASSLKGDVDHIESASVSYQETNDPKLNLNITYSAGMQSP